MNKNRLKMWYHKEFAVVAVSEAISKHKSVRVFLMKRWERNSNVCRILSILKHCAKQYQL